MTAPMMPQQGQPQQPQQPPQPPTPPWTPFAPLPMDDEPAVAAIRKRRLGRLMATTEFMAQPAEWRETVTQAYTTARQALATAQGAQAQLPNTRAAASASQNAQGGDQKPPSQVPTNLTAG